MSDTIYTKSVAYHNAKPYGKIAIQITKPMSDQLDLSLAYSPGVARPCELIHENPLEAYNLTSKGNLVAVISNGTAVLGLGNIGALASKPVMEGKAALFKKFSGVDSIDIEIDETDPDKLIEIIASLEPSFGGINLEDIKAPECFYIEEKLKERMNIPVFHDDQHGTAIVVAAGIVNSLKLVDKKIDNVRIVFNGAGSAAIACAKLLLTMGVREKNLLMCDREGVIHSDRTFDEGDVKRQFMTTGPERTLQDALTKADVFIGLSAAKAMSADMAEVMGAKPIIFALANPEPEIHPDIVSKVRPDAIMATGRSDFPNQVNNAICFPYLFRGALDVNATAINEEMKIACVHALAKIAQSESTDIVANAYGGVHHTFGPEYIIPKPFDKRLHTTLPLAVAKAAMDSGVARRPIEDFKSYAKDLEEFAYTSSQVMRPIFEMIDENHENLPRIAFAEGEEIRVLQAVQDLVDKKACRPILIGRPDIIQQRIEKISLRLVQDRDFDVVDPAQDARFDQYWQAYHDLMERSGVTASVAKNTLRTNFTVIAAMMVKLQDADGMVCGSIGQYHAHSMDIQSILGLKKDVHHSSTLSVLSMDTGPLFIADPLVPEAPTIEHMLEMTSLAIDCVKRFQIDPKVAFVSRSNFGTLSHASALVMREAAQQAKLRHPDIQIDGEMHADVALTPHLRQAMMPHSTLEGMANVLIMPSIDAAHISYTMIKALTQKNSIGPILLGVDAPVHIASHTVSVRGLVNLSMLAIAEVSALNK